MPGWGLDAWGTSGYGAVNTGIGGGLGVAPVITTQLPGPNTVNNDEDSVICVDITDVDLLSASTSIYINDQLAFDGTLGFQSPYIGINKTQTAIQTIKITNPSGWGFNTLVKVRVVATDATALKTDTTWTWRTREDPVCYTGLTPLPVESVLVNPFTIYTPIESLRTLLLGVALNSTSYAASNATQKAARVLYQQAYRTEIAVVQNPYIVRNTVAVNSVVCEQNRATSIDRVIKANKPQFLAGITSLRNQQLYSDQYASEFVDYLDSTIYHYRVSMAANLVLLAAAAELRA